MKNYLKDLCNAADIDKVTDFNLLALAEQCAILEERVCNIAGRLCPTEQDIINDYIDTRNDLECESLRAALRWGMQHPK